MKWSLGITLYPESSYLEISVRLINRTPLVHTFLYWANVAVHTHSEYQVIFPSETQFVTYHGKNRFAHWPVARETYGGVDYTGAGDLSWWKNHPRATSMFAWESTGNFLAGYDHRMDAGVVHVAHSGRFPGKKFWTWGTGERGKRWEKILTETDGPYLELMVGAYSDNQPDYSWIQPGEMKRIVHLWFPIRELRGVKAANRHGALNLERGESGDCEASVQLTSARNVHVVLEAGGRTVLDRNENLAPDRTLVERIEVPVSVPDNRLRLSVLSASGDTLITYQPSLSDSSEMPLPVRPPPPPSGIGTAEECYLAGQRLEQFHNPALDPMPYFRESLKRDPGFSRAHTALGISYLKRLQTDLAGKHLRQAVRRLTNDYTRPKECESLYYLGLVLLRKGEIDSARAMFHRAAWDAAWHTPAYTRLAEIALGRNDLEEALDAAERAIWTNTNHTRGWVIKGIIMRKRGALTEAHTCLQRALDLDPLDFWAAWERIMVLRLENRWEEADRMTATLSRSHRSNIQAYLEICTDYMACGLWDEAIDILEHYEGRLKPGECSALAAYYLGYLWDRRKEPERSRKYYQEGKNRSPQYVFPFRHETERVLTRALEQDSSDARACVYLGNLLFDHQPAKAVSWWERSRRLDSTYSVVHRNLGLAYAWIDGDLHSAEEALEKAVACNPGDPRPLLELDQVYEASGTSAEKRLKVLETHHETVLKRNDALSREIKMLVSCGYYDRAIELLLGHHFHVWEGGGRIYNVYADACLLRGLDRWKKAEHRSALQDFQSVLAYPENLEVGRPERDPREVSVNYWTGKVYESMEDTARTREAYQRAAGFEEAAGIPSLYFYRAGALRALGREQEARALYDRLIQTAQERIQSNQAMDFFAKFGERQAQRLRMGEAYYLLALGHLGCGRHEQSREAFRKALEQDPAHVWAGYWFHQHF
jgi:tetratricopeptide (TPR) repeat protein